MTTTPGNKQQMGIVTKATRALDNLHVLDSEYPGQEPFLLLHPVSPRATV